MRTGVPAKAFALKSKCIGMVLFNLFGACVFLLVASLFWADPRLADIPGAGGADPILWGMIAFPIIKFFALLNLLFILWACIAYLAACRWILGWNYLLVLVIWVVAIFVDLSRH
jgi:hypothetical protein